MSKTCDRFFGRAALRRLLTHPRLRTFALIAALFVILGAGVQGCLLFDLLTALYTGTYSEFGACPLDAGGNSCEVLGTAYAECRETKGFTDPECEHLHDLYWDCNSCDIEIRIEAAFGPPAPKQGAQVSSARVAASPEIYWSSTSSQVFRTAGALTSVEEVFDAGRWPLGIVLDTVAGKVYWTDGRTLSIRRADLDGSNIEDLISGLRGSGLALDPSSQMLYVGNVTQGKVERLNLSTLATEVVASDAFSPVDIVFDTTSSMLYWTQYSFDGGLILGLDTTTPGDPDTVVTGLTLPFGLALDPGAGMLYWSDPGDNAIRSIDLSTPAVINDVLTGLNRPGGLTVDGPGGMLYWAEAGVAQLKSADLADPVNTMQTVNGFTAVADLALDQGSDLLYWTGWVSGSLLRSNVDGSAFEVLTFPQTLLGDLALDLTRQKVYWGNASTGIIQRADLNGNNIEDITDLQFSLGALAFDPLGDKVYWTTSGNVVGADPDGANVDTLFTGIIFIGDLEIESQGGKLYWIDREFIRRGNLDGTGGTETFLTESDLVGHLALHDSILYWSVPGQDVIRRLALDGSLGPEDVVTGLDFVQEIDIAGDKLYWSLPLDSTIQRSNLNGSNVEDVLLNAGGTTGMVTEEITLLPVELSSFHAFAEGNGALLQWTTASETNNAGFSVEWKPDNGEQAWTAIGFVDGAGNTLRTQHYEYRVSDLSPGRHLFRLKQLDFGGAFTYSSITEVTIVLDRAFLLAPAYPNPFNQMAEFSLAVKQTQDVEVAVYDIQGRRMAVLYEGPLNANRTYTFVVDGSRWTSGVYVYEVTGERFRQSRSVLLVK